MASRVVAATSHCSSDMHWFAEFSQTPWFSSAMRQGQNQSGGPKMSQSWFCIVLYDARAWAKTKRIKNEVCHVFLFQIAGTLNSKGPHYFNELAQGFHQTLPGNLFPVQNAFWFGDTLMTRGTKPELPFAQIHSLHLDELTSSIAT